MIEKPKCKLCRERHNSWEPHVLKAPTVTDVTPVTTVTGGDDPTVTYVTLPIPPYEPIVMGRGVPAVMPGEPCPACGRKMPSKNAERQRAWRERHDGDLP